MMVSVSTALQYIHSLEIVHLDIKPENILIGKEGQYKLGDFGIARYIDEIKTNEISEGDQRYLCKELMCQNQTGIKSQLDLKKVDVFALGCTAYQLIEGIRLPLNGPGWHDLREGRIVFSNHANYDNNRLAFVRQMMHAEASNRPTVEQIIEQFTLQNDF